MRVSYLCNLINPVNFNEASYQKKIYINIRDNIISSVKDRPEPGTIEVYDMSEYVCYPGFIDLHTHIYQHSMQGSYRGHLLQWLNEFTFPEEIKTKDNDISDFIAENMFRDLVSCGTSTACLYSTIFKNAFDIAVKKAQKYGVRSIIGKVMMDMNSPDELTEESEKSVNDSIELFKTYNKLDDLIEFSFTPRFALSCSEKLMKLTGDFIKHNPAYIQTHISENKDEVDTVKEIFKNTSSYTEVYYKSGLLTPLTMLAHGIHLSDNELQLIKQNQSSIVHCPDSNFFLKSGAFPLKKILDFDIAFGLGSDVGAGTNLYMPYHAKMMIYRQDNYPVTPINAFYSFTLGSAKVLKKSNIIGSVKAGKQADLVFVKQDISSDNPEDILSKLIFTTDKSNIKKLIINGKTCFER